MGEHSIITPEARVIDRESGSRVVCKLARDFTAGGPASSAGDVRRPDNSNGISGESNEISDSKKISGFERAAVSTRDDDRVVVVVVGEAGTRREARGGLASERKSVKPRLKWRRHHPSRCATSSVTGVSAIASLVGRVSVLVLSLLGLTRGSRGGCVVATSGSSRGPPLVSSSWALVSLLVVGLLRPTVAVPTSNAAAAAAAASASPIGRGGYADATLTRIMPERRESEARTEDEAGKLVESVVEATMKRRRLAVEETSDNYDGEPGAGAPMTLLPSTSVLQHPRESGLESRSRLREAELDTIRRSIVEGLGLERIPDPSKANVSQTEYRRAHQEYLTRLHTRAGRDERVRRLYTFHAAERRSASLVNRTRRSASIEPEYEDQVATSHRGPGALYFPLEIPEDDALVDHASLRLLVDASLTTDDRDTGDVSLYRITPDSRHFVSRQKLPDPREGPRWIELDVTELVSLWHEYGVENLGVELRFEGRVRRSQQPRISGPALNVFTSRLTKAESRDDDEDDDDVDEDARGARRKRQASPERLLSLHKGRRTECRGENKKCCRHQMTVVFKDIEGFEFIVQPKSFDAGYCKGRCPPRYNPAHHHALLQSLIWKEDKRKAPRPCCAPSKLDELEILYFDENNPNKLKLSSWKNMKVLECACS